MKLEKGEKMFITTAGRADEKMKNVAHTIASQLEVKYISRKKRSIKKLQQIEQTDCIVIGKNRFELYRLNEQEPFFFHPNSAMFRVKRLMDKGNDPFIEATKLRDGMSILDCTLGLASDSIVASFVVGKNGTVVGIEVNKYIAYLVKSGLKSWLAHPQEISEAMQRIKVIHDHHLTYLNRLPTNSFDCVYFDPMFEEHLPYSNGISSLSKLAAYETLSEQVIEEALRVAKKRVVLKDHFRSSRFEQFGFTVIQRKSAKFHFGVIEKSR